jgi:hypothetical protein
METTNGHTNTTTMDDVSASYCYQLPSARDLLMIDEGFA